jgi:hypothetical protein
MWRGQVEEKIAALDGKMPPKRLFIIGCARGEGVRYRHAAPEAFACLTTFLDKSIAHCHHELNSLGPLRGL